MRLRTLLIPILLLGCKREVVPDVPPARQAIAVQYVGAPEMEVRKQPEDTAPVIAKFLSGESVSILARQGEWVEVRTGTGTGWVRAGDLTTAEAAAKEEDNPTPRFRKPPSPVSSRTAHGTVYIEAAVNTDGQVTATKILTNTTGDAALAQQNAEALRQSAFYPIVQRGKKKDFFYYYRVDY